MQFKLAAAIAVVATSLAPLLAVAEPMNAGSLRLSGKTQTECLRAAASGLKDAGFENVNRGKTSSGEPGASYFANDKPYYAVVFCEGDVAFVAISGPSLEKRREMHGKITKAIRGQ